MVGACTYSRYFGKKVSDYIEEKLSIKKTGYHCYKKEDNDKILDLLQESMLFQVKFKY